MGKVIHPIRLYLEALDRQQRGNLLLQMNSPLVGLVNVLVLSIFVDRDLAFFYYTYFGKIGFGDDYPNVGAVLDVEGAPQCLKREQLEEIIDSVREARQVTTEEGLSPRPTDVILRFIMWPAT